LQPFTLLPATGSEQVDEWIRLGTEAQIGGNFPKAEQFYRSALRLNPNHATATHNLAVLLACTGQLNDACLAMERATLFDGVEPVLWANKALLGLESDRIDEALAAAARAVALAPEPPADPTADPLKTAGYLNSRLAFAMVSAAAGRPGDSLPAYNDMLAIEPKHPAAGPNACFVTSLMDVGPRELRAQRDRWYAAHRVGRPAWPHRNAKDPEKVLRVGYVGGDFKSHSAAMMFSNVILHHDKSQVDAYLYSSLPTDPAKDDVTGFFRKAANWREVVGKSDEDVVSMIEADGIDILVDLAGHTNGGRLGVFCHKPAPVQVTAWGFAHGTGLPEIDYFFADPVAVPAAERPAFSERIYDLPCVVTYRPPTEYQIRETSPLPYWHNDYVTFGSFSRFEKLSDDCLAAFREILKQVPNSRLYLKDHSFKRPYSIRRVLNAMEGIEAGRVIFGGSTSHPEHLLEYQKVDMILDPWPHGAGVVTLETLYCGVPILTRYGTQPSGRTAASVLTVLGRTDWVAKDAAEYVAKAVEWAGRPHDLAAARKTLRAELVNSPVIAGYAGAVESAYRAIWREYCAK